MIILFLLFARSFVQENTTCPINRSLILVIKRKLVMFVIWETFLNTWNRNWNVPDFYIMEGCYISHSDPTDVHSFLWTAYVSYRMLQIEVNAIFPVCNKRYVRWVITFNSTDNFRTSDTHSIFNSVPISRWNTSISFMKPGKKIFVLVFGEKWIKTNHIKLHAVQHNINWTASRMTRFKLPIERYWS